MSLSLEGKGSEDKQAAWTTVGTGFPAALVKIRLLLLPSGPDRVHGSHRTGPAANCRPDGVFAKMLAKYNIRARSRKEKSNSRSLRVRYGSQDVVKVTEEDGVSA